MCAHWSPKYVDDVCLRICILAFSITQIIDKYSTRMGRIVSKPNVKYWQPNATFSSGFRVGRGSWDGENERYVCETEFIIRLYSYADFDKHTRWLRCTYRSSGTGVERHSAMREQDDDLRH